MKRRPILLLFLPLLLLGGLVVSTAAQERTLTAVATQSTYVPGGWTEVEHEGVVYLLDPSVPEQAYVTDRVETTEATTVALLFFRHTSDGFLITGPETYEATGVLTGARAGDRLALVLVGN